MEITGITALVTGGASGLGEASVRCLKNAGANVAVLDFDADRGDALAAELGDSARFFKTDVSDELSVSSAVGGAVEAFGPLHAVVNCAGIAPPAKVVGKKGLMPIEAFNRVLQVNLVGTMNVIRLAVDVMRKNGLDAEGGENGVVINTASVAAFEGQVGQSAYSASKAGVVGLTLPLAREFAAYGIRVVTVAPGLFETPMMAGLPEKARVALEKMPPFPKRLGRPQEFAQLVRQIIENQMLNGETIRLDGALRMAAA